ncbi:MAG: response regulator transcription factor [Rhodospirillales bacterium]
MGDVSVLHIDQNQLFREGLRQLLRDSNFNMAGQAASLAEGFRQMANNPPTVVIIDVNGNGDQLLKLMEELEDILPKPRVVVLTEAFCLNSLTAALCAGVDGYLLKSMSPGAFEQSLNLVLTGEKVFPTDLAYLLINNRFVAKPDGSGNDKSNGNSLSNREMEVLSCLVNGHSNKSIANFLDLTEGTVKVHLKTILKKIDVNNRTQAAIWALQNGIVSDSVSARSSKNNLQEMAESISL